MRPIRTECVSIMTSGLCNFSSPFFYVSSSWFSVANLVDYWLAYIGSLTPSRQPVSKLADFTPSLGPSQRERRPAIPRCPRDFPTCFTNLIFIQGMGMIFSFSFSLRPIFLEEVLCVRALYSVLYSLFFHEALSLYCDQI